MRIIRCETLASTSDEASERLATGQEKPPFAVIARQQTGGRGRSGKQWESPRGNLYLTLVIDSLPEARRARISLAVATAVAHWIKEKFALRITIKWPNDLLFAGAKLGGILCESSVQGQTWGPMMIGVGLNLRQAPPVKEQASICLGDLCPLSDDPLQLAEELALSLAAQLQDEKIEQGFRHYAIEDGQLWKDSNGQFAAQSGMDEAGHLRVRELLSGREHSLSSVRHEWQWVYQHPEETPLLALDIGNSLCKLGIFTPATRAEPELHRFTLQHQGESDRAALAARLMTLGLPRAWPVHAIAVRDALVGPLREWLSTCGFQLHFLPKRSLKLDYSAYRFDELGIDRLALAEAAFELYPRQNLIVVSAGTAVTVEVISARGFYKGGYILPGLQTKLNALHLRTGRLPRIELSDIDPASVVGDRLLGQDTRSAMLRGVLRETQLALRGLSFELEQDNAEGAWQVVCTGGDGEFLSRLLGVPYDPFLILKGIKMMSMGGARSQLNN